MGYDWVYIGVSLLRETCEFLSPLVVDWEDWRRVDRALICKPHLERRLSGWKLQRQLLWWEGVETGGKGRRTQAISNVPGCGFGTPNKGEL